MGTPAAGRIDTNHACMHNRSAPIGNLLNLTTGKDSGIATILKGNSMKSLARATNIDSHAGDGGGH
jgi:hypothetical protein